ncbi:uncharacterized protein MAM_07572 [Metarhizium album ARSEF 1941]|uniref:Uncharacterized protein n=1 Tax=Metarhizium album (strain ARSEF 1941) TaxID=1081103 RepID=A0A0B2WM00_METAS|nr:uncharacterized protein MAM_07572 [Metarhizium album ARSEF 1941]KHN94517.1 hypothetical protein MAM_07572 [Metarhizium album ARSEF 1941]
MHLMSLFVVGALGAGMSSLKKQIMAIQPDLVEHYASIVEPLVPPRFWAAQVGFYEPLVGVGAKPICGCKAEEMFQLHEVFFSNITDRVRVDFHPYADSQPFSGDIWYESSTTTTTSRNFKWENSGEVSVEWSLQFSGSGSKLGAKFGYKVGEDNVRTKTRSFAEKKRLTCPRGHLCQAQTWSFSASIPGNFFKVPVVDFRCSRACLRWKHEGTDLYHELNQTSKVALASLAGLTPTWDRLGREYFELRDDRGDAVVSCPPGGDKIVGIQFPPDSIETVYRHGRPHQPSIPVMDNDNNLYQIQIMMDFSRKHFPGQNRRDFVEAHLTQEDLASMDARDAEVKVYVLDTNVPGLRDDERIGN